jgi:hypothetical protein
MMVQKIQKVGRYTLEGSEPIINEPDERRAEEDIGYYMRYVLIYE